MYSGDRMNLQVKEFGRKVIIDVRLGKAVWNKSKKRLTINYTDSPQRLNKGPR
jgi:hypothetical protein